MKLSDIISALKLKPDAINAADESIYEFIAAEVATKQMRPGIYAKAFADASGDLNRATANYITYRAAQIRKEISDALAEELRHSRTASVDLSRAAQLISTEGEERERLRKKYAELDAEEARIAAHEKRVGRQSRDLFGRQIHHE